MRSRAIILIAILFVACTPAPHRALQPAPSSGEAATAAYMSSIRNGSPALTMFLREMPKGGDLHNHLWGSIYAESFIKWAAEDGLCLTISTLSVSPPPCAKADNEISASQMSRDQSLYDRVIDAWSVRNWNPARKSGHDQFFETFDKFDAAGNGHVGGMLAEVASRAASQNISYLELMLGPDRAHEFALASRLGDTRAFAAMRDKLLALGLRDSLAASRTDLDAAESKEKQLLGCGQSNRDAGCAVTIRFLYQVLRGLDQQLVFAQLLTGFEMARFDHRWVGLNMVMPEDGLISMRDFRLHMQMIDFLHKLYPEVKITLHAGELAEGLVPPDGMRFHIRESVGAGHALRIGHGTDIMHEDSAGDLLREMASRKIPVEISLSSSDVILGISGTRHPIRTYLEHGVPVVLATDDEGVSRTSLTTEYRRAVQEQSLDYPTLKRIVRNSIEFSFAEDTVKARLARELDDSFRRFESQPRR
jgi:adenosine deaminase